MRARTWFVWLFLIGFLGLTAVSFFPLHAQIEPTLHANLVDVFPDERFASPVDIAHAGDERLFIVEQAGKIMVVEAGAGKPGRLKTATTFLDITPQVTSGDERGLLGLVFHPDYASNGFFYVNYTRQVSGSLHTRIARYEVSGDRNVADPNSEFVILDIAQPFGNHNAGDLAFGPDGYLYVPTGDGGSGGDPNNRAQNLNDLLGKILRLDVDATAGGRNYAIPADNPFVGEAGRDEIWAYGLRNPWRISFDRATNDLFIGDVGQREWEEIDLQPADSGGGENYGWRLKEGDHCFNPATGCDPGGLVDPIYEYGHRNGRCSVTGGFVYRGPEYASLRGTYIMADFCTGELFGLREEENGRWQPALLTTAPRFVSTFGEDVAGELYLATLDGVIYQIQARPLPFRNYLPTMIK